jgi:membrane protein
MASENAVVPGRTAPEPDAPGKAESPTDLGRAGWRFTAKAALAEFKRDQCTDMAAALTYYSVLSIFPALLALVSLLGVFGQGKETTDALLEILERLGQDQIAEQLKGPIEAMQASQAAGLALVIGLGGALWSASGYVGAFGRAMNRVYHVQEGRPVWKLRPVVLLVTIGLVVMAALVLVGLVVSGPIASAIGEAIGFGEQTQQIWSIARWPVMLVIVVLMVAVLYYATPNVKQPKFRWVSVGSAVAIGIWVLASLGFGFYVTNFGKYNSLYGSLGGIIIFLLWLWLTNLALLVGAELDAELERARELEAGIRAEHRIQLPLRDSSGTQKAEEKHAERVAEGRRLRLEATAGTVAEPGNGYSDGDGRRRRARHGAAASGFELEPLPSQRARATAERDD